MVSKKDTTTERTYEAPMLTVATFKAEKGYAATNPDFLPAGSMELWNNQTNQMENYETRDNWNSGGSFWD